MTDSVRFNRKSTRAEEAPEATADPDAPTLDRGYGVRVKGAALRREMDVRGITGADVARRAQVAPSTVSQAVRGRRIHPRKLQAIVAVLAQIEPIPHLAELLEGQGDGLG